MANCGDGMARIVKTRSGRTFFEADIERLAARSRAGPDLSDWRPRRGRPALDAAAGERSPRIAVRVPQSLHDRVTARAAREGRSMSEIVRELLENYAAPPASSKGRTAGEAQADADQAEIARFVRMTDREREAYYLATNQNMLRMFDDARDAR